MTEQIRTGPDWEDVRVFLALARHGNLSAAARALGVNHATVSRRVRALEEAMGQTLVERRPDGFVLTPAGQRMLAPASDMEAAAAALARSGPEGKLNGLVRVSAPPSLAQSFLMPHLVALCADHPGLDVDLAADVRSVSLVLRETDIAIRMQRPSDGDVIARRLASFGCGFYGTAAWQRRIAQGAAPVFVGFDEQNAHLPDALWLSRQFPKIRVAIRASNHMLQRVAAREGAGLALLPHYVAKAEPKLKLCAVGPTPPQRELWMVTRRDDGRNPAIRAVGDALVKAFEAHQPVFQAPA